MGRRGPQKTPTAILERRGSWRAKARKNEPKPKSGRPVWPADLRGKPYAVAQREWRRIVPILEAMGTLATADRSVLVDYCLSWQQFCQATREAAHGGLTTMTDKGNLVLNPAFSALMKLRGHLLKAAREFGLSPASRAGVTVTDKDDVDENKARYFRTA